MVQRNVQRSNTQPETRLKAERLTVLDLTAHEAVIEGDHDDYTVVFHGLTCSCPAGQRGLHCSHAQAAIRERARMNGFEHTAFSPNQQHASAYAAMQRATGKHAVEHVEYGYYFVTSGKPVAAAVVAPKRSHDAIQADVDRWF